MNRFLLTLLIVVIAALSFWAGGRFGGPLSPPPGARPVLYYVDPMNPGFRSDHSGTAPCGMPLEPVYADTSPAKEAGAGALPPGAVQISPARQQLIGVKVASVEIRPMTHTLRLYGRIVADETRVYRVNASTDSWIRELSDVTTGSLVSRNQILAQALAPAFYNAQVTYLLAMDNLDRIKQQLGGQLRHQQAELSDNQIRMAVQSLQNLGITDAQVEQLANTRQARPYLQVRAPTRGVVLSRSLTLNQWFKAGEEFYKIADIGRVWVYADVYEHEIRHLHPGMTVVVRHPQLGKTFHARVSEALPLFDPVSKTLKVRIDVDNPHYDLRPEMFVDVEIPLTFPPALHVTADAVIDSGTKTFVYVDLGDGIFVPRKVDTGWKLGRQVEITGGLMSGEKVVVSGNFLIDSESRMRTAASGVELPSTKDPVCGMLVDSHEAKEASRFMILAGTTYHFCSQECQQRFHEHPDQYVGKGQGLKAVSGKTVAPGLDPVCGMQVDLHQAEITGLFLTLEGVTYQFCSRDCMLKFLKDHRKYAVKTQSGQSVSHTAMPGMDHSQSDMGASPAMPQDRMLHNTQTGVRSGHSWAPIPPAESPRGASGGSSAPSQEWSVGWGKFPGAEYLGLKDRKRKAGGESTSSASVQSGEDREKADDAAGHHPATMASSPTAEDATAKDEDTPPVHQPDEEAPAKEKSPSPSGMGEHHH